MAFPTKDGKNKFGNRMKANRYDKAHESEGEKPSQGPSKAKAAVEGAGGPRAEEHRIEAHGDAKSERGGAIGGAGEHEMGGGSGVGEQLAQEHGPAVETHTYHNDATGEHLVHSVHQDGHQNHSKHASREEAQMHAKAAAGIPGGMGQKDEGQYPMEHHSATANGEKDEYEVPSL